MKEQDIKSKLIKKRKAIRKKLEDLKSSEISLHESYLPITKSISKLINPKLEKHLSDEPTVFKEPIKSEHTNIANRTIQALPEDEIFRPPQSVSSPTQARFIDDSEIFQNIPAERSSYDDYESVLDQTRINKTLDTSYLGVMIPDDTFQMYLNDYDELPRMYIEAKIRDTSNDFDTLFGIRHNLETEKFYIGNSELIFKGNDISIRGIDYKGTPGLYELLFKKEPIGYTPEDSRNYRDIVNRTNAHRRGYLPEGQIAGNRSNKYKHIVQPLFSNIHQPAVFRGGSFSGQMEYNNNSIDHVYWDDPNELVDRLQLLLASQMAGNNSHANEINSILEELKEADIIE